MTLTGLMCLYVPLAITRCVSFCIEEKTPLRSSNILLIRGTSFFIYLSEYLTWITLIFP